MVKLLLSTGSTKEDPSRHNRESVYWDLKNQIKQKVYIFALSLRGLLRKIRCFCKMIGFKNCLLKLIKPLVCMYLVEAGFYNKLRKTIEGNYFGYITFEKIISIQGIFVSDRTTNMHKFNIGNDTVPHQMY